MRLSRISHPGFACSRMPSLGELAATLASSVVAGFRGTTTKFKFISTYTDLLHRWSLLKTMVPCGVLNDKAAPIIYGTQNGTITSRTDPMTRNVRHDFQRRTIISWVSCAPRGRV